MLCSRVITDDAGGYIGVPEMEPRALAYKELATGLDTISPVQIPFLPVNSA